MLITHQTEHPMREIPLTKGYVALVDDEDFDALARWKWQRALSGDRVYAQRIARDETGRKYTILMHRAIMGAEKGQQVDHVDGDSLNNRRANLRLCTARQNQFNKASARHTSSQYKGVHWAAKNGKWMAAIRLKDRKQYLGLFHSERDAAAAYDAAALKLHGDFARLNLPPL